MKDQTHTKPAAAGEKMVTSVRVGTDGLVAESDQGFVAIPTPGGEGVKSLSIIFKGRPGVRFAADILEVLNRMGVLDGAVQEFNRRRSLGALAGGGRDG